jgi:hypothetical protein
VLAFTKKKSLGPRRPSPFASVNEKVALPPASGGPSFASVTLFRERLACSFDKDTRAPTDVTSSRVKDEKSIFTGVATGG